MTSAAWENDPQWRLTPVARVIAEALVASHDAADCTHDDVDGDQQCPDCDARWAVKALTEGKYLR